MTGMSVVDGVPHVWGKPATKDSDEPLLSCFSQYRCPHCQAHLSAGPPVICLNACHLTAPQVSRFHSGLRAAVNAAGVDRI